MAKSFTFFPASNEEVSRESALLIHTLQRSKNVVVIAGAGMSADPPAGIHTFKDPDGLPQRYGGKSILDQSVYNSKEKLQQFYEYIQLAVPQVLHARPTRFHHFLGSLAREERLLRLYTQNIDGLEEMVPELSTQTPLSDSPELWPNTVQTHGSLRYMGCTKCSYVARMNILKFKGPVPSACPACELKDAADVKNQKRSKNPGALRPRILLYNQIEDNWENNQIDQVTFADLDSEPDALIVAGTALDIPGTRGLVKSFSEAVHRNPQGITIWVNTEAPKHNMAQYFDIVVQGSCDQVAEYVSY